MGRVNRHTIVRRALCYSLRAEGAGKGSAIVVRLCTLRRLPCLSERPVTELVDFRRCLGHFATGVTVISCCSRDGVATGITANSFSSVSLEPPLVLWNIAKVSRSLTDFLDADYFGINVLHLDQEPLATHFARSEDELFADVPSERSANGVPRLGGSLAWLECRTHAVHDSGDHYIIVGEVIDYAARAGEPLLFYRGQYGRLQQPE